MSARDIFQFQVDGSTLIRIKQLGRDESELFRERERETKKRQEKKKKDRKVIEGQQNEKDKKREKNVIRRRPEKLVCQFEVTEMEKVLVCVVGGGGGSTIRWTPHSDEERDRHRERQRKNGEE